MIFPATKDAFALPQMAEGVANKALRQYQIDGTPEQVVVVDDVKFEAWVRRDAGNKPAVLTVYPIGLGK